MNTNRYGEEFRICTACKISHVENCGSCFGWGFMKKLSGNYNDLQILSIVSASDAHGLTEDKVEFGYPLSYFIKCKECGSGICGAS